MAKTSCFLALQSQFARDTITVHPQSLQGKYPLATVFMQRRYGAEGG